MLPISVPSSANSVALSPLVPMSCANRYRIVKYVGAYTAALGGVDVIVFTAGVGENQIELRESVCKQLEFLGIDFDPERNNCRGEEVEITRPGSKVRVVVIPTDEEYMIACDTKSIVEGAKK